MRHPAPSWIRRSTLILEPPLQSCIGANRCLPPDASGPAGALDGPQHESTPRPLRARGARSDLQDSIRSLLRSLLPHSGRTAWPRCEVDRAGPRRGNSGLGQACWGQGQGWLVHRVVDRETRFSTLPSRNNGLCLSAIGSRRSRQTRGLGFATTPSADEIDPADAHFGVEESNRFFGTPQHFEPRG